MSRRLDLLVFGNFEDGFRFESLNFVRRKIAPQHSILLVALVVWLSIGAHGEINRAHGAVAKSLRESVSLVVVRMRNVAMRAVTL